MLFLPLTMIELSAEVDIEFDDTEELEQNPMAKAYLAQAMMSLEELLGQMGINLKELRNGEVDFS